MIGFGDNSFLFGHISTHSLSLSSYIMPAFLESYVTLYKERLLFSTCASICSSDVGSCWYYSFGHAIVYIQIASIGDGGLGSGIVRYSLIQTI
jgi:hypothetical protein